MERSILVTGATGFFGRAFTRAVLDAGATRVCIYSRGEHAQAQMREAFGNDDRLRFFIGDVRDERRLRRAMEGTELVVHAAALKRIEVGHYNPTEMVQTNVLGTINVIEAATEAGVHKVIGLSSDKAHEARSAYGQSKALAESLLLAANHQRGRGGPRYACVRYGNVWASSGSIVPRWLEIKRNGGDTVPVTDPQCTRFFMRASEAVQLVLQTARTMIGGELAIPDLPAYRVGDLVEAMGMKMRVIGLPAHEKLHEGMSLGNSSDKARRMTIAELQEALLSCE